MKKTHAKWILDIIYLLRGERVWNALDEIEQIQWLDSSSLKALQFDRIKRIITLAYHNNPYYRKVLEANKIHPTDIQSFEDVSKLPILDKEDIRKNVNLLGAQNENVRTSVRYTSGLTGIPLKIEKDRRTTALMDAVMYRSYGWYGITPGEKQLRIWGTKINPVERIGTHLKDFLLNRVRLSAFELNENYFLKTVEKVKKMKPRYIYGYAQSVFQFAKFIEDQNIRLDNIKFKAVIVTGEMSFDWQRETIKKSFDCPVVNEYGCTEVGIIAIECPFGRMHIMADALYVECPKSEQDSEEGDIVLTELNNFHAPFIRYRIGDRGIILNSSCKCGCNFPQLSSLKGRSDEFILFPDGRKVDPYIFEYILKGLPKKYGAINQFEIIQDADSSLTVRLVCGPCDEKKIGKAIEDNWSKLYGKCVPLKFQFVTELTKNKSGKLSCFKSQIKS